MKCKTDEVKRYTIAQNYETVDQEHNTCALIIPYGIGKLPGDERYIRWAHYICPFCSAYHGKKIYHLILNLGNKGGKFKYVDGYRVLHCFTVFAIEIELPNGIILNNKDLHYTEQANQSTSQLVSQLNEK